MLNNISVTEFSKTIRSVYGGIKVVPSNLMGEFFSQIVGQALEESVPSASLKSIRMTKREIQVAKLIGEGATNKEIAQTLGLSSYTVKSHVHNILEKLALSTRVQIAKHVHLLDSLKSVSDNNSNLKE